VWLPFPGLCKARAWVFTVPDELQQAIAAATPERLAEVAAAVIDSADPDDDSSATTPSSPSTR
jgi:hypothetical protein